MTDQLVVRDITVTYRSELLDHTVVDEVIRRDVYRIRNMRLRGKTVVDCGAHIGIFTIACLTRGAAKVIAVEPQPANLELLRTNVGRFPQVTVVDHALADRNDRTFMFGESGGAHTGADAPNGIETPTITLAELLDDVGPVDLMKLDMEGGEVAALLACDHDHLATVRRIVMETHGPNICPWVERPHVGDVIEHLLPTHNVEAAGFPTHLGMIWAERNGCDHGW